jgi:hypothetical protein
MGSSTGKIGRHCTWGLTCVTCTWGLIGIETWSDTRFTTLHHTGNESGKKAGDCSW